MCFKPYLSMKVYHFLELHVLAFVGENFLENLEGI